MEKEEAQENGTNVQGMPVSTRQVMMDLEWSNLQNKMVNANPEQFSLTTGQKKTWKWWTVMTFIFLLLFVKMVLIICIIEGIIKV